MLALYMSSTITPVAGLQPAIGINLGSSFLSAAIQTDQEATRELVKIEGMFPYSFSRIPDMLRSIFLFSWHFGCFIVIGKIYNVLTKSCEGAEVYVKP